MLLFKICCHVFLIFQLFSLISSDPLQNLTKYSDYVDRYSCTCEVTNSHAPEVLYSDYRPLNSLQKLHCCSGSPKCRLVGNNASSEEGHLGASNLLMCFSDLYCVGNAKSPVSGLLYYCSRSVSSCCAISHQLLNISNVHKETSLYHCFWVADFEASICLLPKCQDFAVVERKCDCVSNKKDCTCYHPVKNMTLPTNALFFSFRDIFIVQNRVVFSTTIVMILIGVLTALGFLLFIIKFGKLCRGSVLKLNCCKHNIDTTLPNVSQVPKIGNSGVQSAVQGDSNSALPSYDEAIANTKVVDVEPPPSYSEARI